MKLFISKGNNKLGKIPNISLPPVITCINSFYCKQDCYALRIYIRTPIAKQRWDENYKLLKNNIIKYFLDLADYLHDNKPEYFRYHVAGDIINNNYFALMLSIADLNPNTKFLAFTKNFNLNFSDIPDNLSIILSIFPNMPIPKIDLPKAWMQDGTENRIPSDAIICKKKCDSCGKCWHLKELKKDVILFKH